MNLGNRVWSVPTLLAAAIVAADQLSKAWVVQTLGPATMTRFIPVVGDTARIAYSQNTGVAFSLFQDVPQFLTFTSLAIIAVAIYFYRTQLPNHQWFVQLIMGLIMGGAFGNLIDRVRLGYVVDFIQIGWFPIFNFADCAISVGAFFLIIQFIREEFAPQRDDRTMVLQ
ncbi:lipoprotein signal peptidase [Oscillochloris trichoides DG-6]|uniref:Lipoprotein signal peptidase n=1 Tax=Oscillochloris trichoides DG-6 TaxID=765420 RepID=E1II33_9CHLR|nr:signal peptidase II [Oscillochloris trichoides]EFO79151.1 lipoprotein signal peptidase [Oscillochloris trichoides DG-6]